MSVSAPPRASVRPKEFHFPLVVEWIGDRRVCAQVDEKPAVQIAPPVVFQGDDPAVWSPEDFLVASAASCLAVTFTGLARRAGLAYERLAVAGDGVCGTRADGRFGFTKLTLRFELETSGDPEEARNLAAQADARCLIAASLDLPVETEIVVNGG
jgi:organic hydroperoxide reductase OsmC/OhrA